MRLERQIGLFACLITTFGLAWAGLMDEPKLREEIVTEVQTIEFTAHYEFGREVGPGRLRKVRSGENGYVKRTYRVITENGKVQRKDLIGEERKEPVQAIIHMGRAGYKASRDRFVRSKVKTMEATAYDPSAGLGKRATFRTATGLPARYGVVAVDPRVIKLGTRLYVEGYGFALAADTGGAIKGNRIDLCVPTKREAMKFGRRQVRVHVLTPM